MKYALKEDIERLANETSEVCLSLYFPTAKAGKETLKNPARLKRMLQESHGELEGMGMDKERIKSFLDPLEKLEEDYEFWQHQEDGIGILHSDNGTHTFAVHMPVPEAKVVSNRFHLKPLLASIYDARHFYLLSLARKHVRFYKGTREGLERLHPENLPESFEEALLIDPEQSLQGHTGGRSNADSGQPHVSMHGQDVQHDELKPHLRQFFVTIDRAIHEELHDKVAPLIVAAVDYYMPIYRDVNTYKGLTEEFVEGSPEHVDPKKLHAEALEIADDYMKTYEEKWRDRVSEALGIGERSTADVDEAVVAAVNGRAEAAFVAVDEEKWGRYDPDNASVWHAEEDRHCTQDLIDLVGTSTVLNSGRTFAVPREDMPADSPVAVLLRY